ncbi:MAG: bifunctional UDP-N-acetylglucosamine diphosphorylase/glucosamine-1-phosphate N-acetyltransferase GlmU [Anaerolineales bacterium]|nr:bifunctional UDP-N-acetylglucosamine diphosphorylase/glucosamine-1-phosphate N-acetyltransferase GlmU [Anaerolineales bacterium]
MSIVALILAAGQGTRLKSKLPKVLHPLAGRALIHYAIDAAQAAAGARPVLVVGHGADDVRAAVGARAGFVEQAEQLGTGHAVLQGRAALGGHVADVLVTYGDMPLLRAETLQALVERRRASQAAIALLTIDSAGLFDFGRVIRASDDGVTAVVEVAQATPAQLALPERNVGAYCFDGAWLWEALERLPLSPKGEYYLTDAVALAVADGRRVEAVKTGDEAETIGINTRAQLAQAEAALRQRVNAAWMTAGVTLVDPATTYIAPTVTIGPDTVIAPNTHLQGATTIGAECEIGPNSVIVDTTIGDRCVVRQSLLESAWLAEDVDVGPFAHLRSGARLERGVHMGNFGEVKNATLGPGVKMGHFSYIGDAQIGSEANISAGTITCNYDGVKKNKTVLGERVFLGSNTLLVAPVTLGDDSQTGAGSVVTRDIPANMLALGVPARVVRERAPESAPHGEGKAQAQPDSAPTER